MTKENKYIKELDELIISGAFDYETRQGYWLNRKKIERFILQVLKSQRKEIIEKIKEKVEDEMKYETASSLENIINFLDNLIKEDE